MPGFNGSGTFVRTHSWVSDRNNAIKIVASRHDAEDDAFASGLSSCIVKDGQTTTTARIPFAHGVSVADGTASAPGVNFVSDANCGLYRIGADNIGLAVGGSKIVDIASTGIAVTGTLSSTGTFSSAALTITSSSANALAVGPSGTTNPVLKVDASTSSVDTGISITGADEGSRAFIAVISSGTNEGLNLDARGSGTIRLGATSTGAIEFSRNAVPTANDGAALGTSSLAWSDADFATGAVLRFANAYTVTHSSGLLTLSHALTVSGTLTANTFASSGATITGGTINNAAIGGSTPAAGAFTTLTASGSATLNTLASSGATITGGTINNAAIGGSTPAAGAFTTLSATGALTVSGVASTFSNAGETRITVRSTGGSAGIIFDSSHATDTLLYSHGPSGELRLSFDAAVSDAFRFTTTNLIVQLNTASNSTDTGSLVNAGGFGNAGAFYNGGIISTAGNIVPTSSDGAALGTSSLMFSDVFLASGGVINWNDGDATVTHSANTLTFGGASSGYKFDAMVAPSSSDGAALGSASLMWSDVFIASGGVINWNNGDATITHASNTLTFAGASSGYQFDALVAPSSSDGAALGSTSLMWSDVFLASGAVINFNNGDVTVAHASNTLTFAGASSGYQFDALVAPSSSDGAALGSASLMWSDAFLASGAVVNFNNGNYTLTHSAGLLTASGALTVSGATTLSSTAAVTGDFAVNTDKFTVAASSGNTLVAGTLAVTGASTLTGALTANNSAGVAARNTVKAFGKVSNGTLAGAFGVTDITDLGNTHRINLSITLPSIDYCVLITLDGGNAGPDVMLAYTNQTATTFEVAAFDASSGTIDPDSYSFMVLSNS